jgi:hypothetical protein
VGKVTTEILGRRIDEGRAAVVAMSEPWTTQRDLPQVGRWLEARHFTCGVDAYWGFSIITARMRCAEDGD